MKTSKKLLTSKKARKDKKKVINANGVVILAPWE